MTEPRPDTPAVSVIVPVRDDAAGVAEVIRRLEVQTLPRERFEVVIGDDGSRPGTLAGVKTADGWVRVVSGPPRTSYAARNRAAAAARGEVLAFCDSDCLPEPEWLEEGLAALEGADLVAGEVVFAPPARPTVWSLLTIDMFLDQGQNVMRSRAVTANVFVSRPLFEALGGFDPSLPSGGDYDFARRAVAGGARLAHAPAAVVRHPTLDSFGAFVRKVFATSRWAAARRARTGQGIKASSTLALMPVVNTVRARRHVGRPSWRLERRQLAASGVAFRRIDQLRALAALYVVVPYVSALARLRGTWDGRRLIRHGPTGSAAP